jgi:hypothetical protein
MSLPPELKQRILAATAEIPSPTQHETLRARVWLFACGVVGALAIFFMEGGARMTPRPPSLVALTSLGTIAIVAIAVWLLFTRGQSVVGRPVSLLIGTTVASSLLFVVWRYGVSAHYGLTESWPARPGFRCLSLGVATGLPPLLAALLSWRRGRRVTPITTGAAFGAGAGLGSAFLVDLWCPVSYFPHLLLGHLLPIALLAVLGGVLGWRLLRLVRR